MITALAFANLALLLILLVVVIMHWMAGRRRMDSAPLDTRLNLIETAVTTTNRNLHDEFSNSRTEQAAQSGQLRGELDTRLQKITEALQTRIDILTNSSVETIARLQTSLEQRFEAFSSANCRTLELLRENLTGASGRLQEQVSRDLTTFRAALDATKDSFAQSSQNSLEQQQRHASTLTMTIDLSQQKLEERQNSFSGQVDTRMKASQAEMISKLEAIQQQMTRGAQEMRQETGLALKSFNDSVLKGIQGMAEIQKTDLGLVRNTLDQRLTEIREENGKKLDEMRQTVDEKLQGTLEKRLGESFRVVSEQLDKVHRGLGEMQTLATGVGDLKRVFSNVKIRGTWGEFQLGAILEQLLTPDQYAANVATTGMSERVEYAIKLPEGVWLPIDAKFPIEDYQRLVEASERADAEATEAAALCLENRLKKSAKDIKDKYLAPPLTTDFAILYLPTEGLYAEALRRPGLQEFLQQEYRVSLAGPTTLAALLNSLQMGFRTLAIQQRSSEVWEVLGKVKTEFANYGDALDKVKKKLIEASNTVDKASTRSRAIHRKLREVETLPDSAVTVNRAVLELELTEDELEDELAVVGT